MNILNQASSCNYCADAGGFDAAALGATAPGAAPPMGFFNKLLKKFASTSVFCGPPAALADAPAVAATAPAATTAADALKLETVVRNLTSTFFVA